MVLLLLSCASAPASETLPPHQVFRSPAQALEAVLASKPRLLGVGELHAQTDGPAIPTTLFRFTQELLPVLAPQTTDLVLETWRPAKNCTQSSTQTIQAIQTGTHRPEQVKDELGDLIRAAVATGIRPHDLEFSCEDWAGVRAEDGSIDYERMMSLVGVKLGDYAKRTFETPDARVVLYGGAAHNDIRPDPSNVAYGALAAQLGGAAYVELDLYDPVLLARVPSLLEEEWAALVSQAGADRTILYQRSPQSFVMLLGDVTKPVDR